MYGWRAISPRTIKILTSLSLSIDGCDEWIWKLDTSQTVTIITTYSSFFKYLMGAMNGFRSLTSFKLLQSEQPTLIYIALIYLKA